MTTHNDLDPELLLARAHLFADQVVENDVPGVEVNSQGLCDFLLSGVAVDDEGFAASTAEVRTPGLRKTAPEVDTEAYKSTTG
ncbi:MAG: hypothetical protein AAGN82_17020 [Myxococcota bacterium]